MHFFKSVEGHWNIMLSYCVLFWSAIPHHFLFITLQAPNGSSKGSLTCTSRVQALRAGTASFYPKTQQLQGHNQHSPLCGYSAHDFPFFSSFCSFLEPGEMPCHSPEAAQPLQQQQPRRGSCWCQNYSAALAAVPGAALCPERRKEEAAAENTENSLLWRNNTSSASSHCNSICIWYSPTVDTWCCHQFQLPELINIITVHISHRHHVHKNYLLWYETHLKSHAS